MFLEYLHSVLLTLEFVLSLLSLLTKGHPHPLIPCLSTTLCLPPSMDNGHAGHACIGKHLSWQEKHNETMADCSELSKDFEPLLAITFIFRKSSVLFLFWR